MRAEINRLVKQGNTLLSCCGDSITVWDTATATEVRTIESEYLASRDFDVSADGKVAVTLFHESRWEQEGPLVLHVWDTSTGVLLQEIEPMGAPFTCLAIHPKGTLVATGCGDNAIRLWDVASGQCIHTLFGHTGPVTDVAIGSAGTLIATASLDRTVRIWDVRLKRLAAVLHNHTGGVNSIAMSADAGIVAARSEEDNKIVVWDAITTAVLCTIADVAVGTCLAVDPHGQYLATTATNDIYVQKIPSLDVHACFSGHPGSIYDISFSDTGSSLASISGDIEDQSAKLWSLKDATETAAETPHQCPVNAAHFDRIGQFAVTCAYDSVVFWETSTASMVSSYRISDPDTGYHGFAIGVNWHSALLLTARGVEVWDLGAKVIRCVLPEHQPTAVAVSGNGLVGVTASYGFELHVWDVTNGRPVGSFKSHANSCIAVDLSGRFAITEGDCFDLDVHDLQTGAVLAVLKGHVDEVRSVSISRDGRHALSCSKDRTIIVWDLETETAVRKFEGHDWYINAGSFCPTSDLICSVSDDCTVRIWDLAKGACRCVFQGSAPFTTCAFGADARTLIVGNSRGEVQFLEWRADGQRSD